MYYYQPLIRFIITNTQFYVPLLTFLYAYLWFIDYGDKDFWFDKFSQKHWYSE